jgi:hypothetical protein
MRRAGHLNSECLQAPMDENPKKIDGLDFDETDDGYVIYEIEKDRVHYLNPTAALVLELCDGTRGATTIVELVREAYALPEPPTQSVTAVLAQMKDEGLLE